MVRGISEVDMATTPFAEGNLASATPQPWKTGPKKKQKNRSVLFKPTSEVKAEKLEKESP